MGSSFGAPGRDARPRIDSSIPRPNATSGAEQAGQWLHISYSRAVANVILARGRVQPVWAGHPWVYAQAIERIDGAPGPGDVVDVLDGDGNHLGRGWYSPRSAIPVRIASRDRRDPLDGPSIGRKVEAAFALRRALGLPSADTTGYRLVNGEGDGLPGIVADVLGDVATVQLLTIGAKLREDDVFAHIARVSGAKTVIEVASEKAAMKEGFAAENRVVRGPDPTTIRLTERGLVFELDAEVRQKTGFYFDQRDNRAMLERLARGARVLDLYSFVGAFALAAARGGAELVRAVDASAPAMAAASRLAHLNGLSGRIEFERADARDEMAALHRKRSGWDIVVLDPPKLAPSVKHLDKARGMYRKLNAEASRLVQRGGLLVSCSCSGAMQPDDFVRTCALGVRDAGRDLVLVHLGQQAPDHPTPAAFAEGRYLKCAFFRVT